MKVLKRNTANAPEYWKAQVVCGACKSLLDVEEDDLRCYNNHDPRGAYETVWFTCGACNTANEVRKISKFVQDRVKKESFPGNIIACIPCTPDLPHKRG